MTVPPEPPGPQQHPAPPAQVVPPAPPQPPPPRPGGTPPAARALSAELGDPAFRRVSSRLIGLHLIGAVTFNAFLAAAVVVLSSVFGESRLLWILILPLLILVVGTAVVARQVRAIGYAERAADLLISNGIMFRRVTVIPYGRLQYVDVKSGPIERAVGLATLHMHTASASTRAVIPGLPREEAVRLREKLASRAESDLAGL